MPTLSGFARKYAIMEELDDGFGSGSVPEAFVRLDSWEGRIQVSVHAKGLKQGPFLYKLYLIFPKGEKLFPILAGIVNTSYSGTQGGLEIDSDTLNSSGLKADTVRFAAITAESNDRQWVPLFSSFEKNYKWDESIRQLLLKKAVPQEKETPSVMYVENSHKIAAPKNEYRSNTANTADAKNTVNVSGVEKPDIKADNDVKIHNKSLELSQNVKGEAEKNASENIPVQNEKSQSSNINNSTQASSPAADQIFGGQSQQESTFNRCDINKMEGLLQNNFEACQPFKRGSRGYSWYRVSDLAKLSNIMYMSGVNVPVFANPKILVGLFKFKHILAGLYRGDNGAHYYVIGVPAKDGSDNKPFENACRWVPVTESQVRDMGGYWLVYVSLKSGEIVV